MSNHRYRLPSLCWLLLCVARLSAWAQESIPGKPVICYGATATHHHPVAAPRLGVRLSQQTVRIEVTYTNFPPEAMAPFQQALDTWSTLLSSPVPIRINATWAALPGNALALTSATKLYRGFAGAVQPDVWYPVALAEKITGRDLNGTDQADINVTINKNSAWYVGTDGNTPADRIDLESVVLHEVAHGLGFASGADSKDSTGSLRNDGYLLIYDRLLETGTNVRLSTYTDPSGDLLRLFTSNTLYLHSPAALAAGQTQFPKVFAPAFYNVGGSISHLDEARYPPGDADALMTPYFALGEPIHSVGTILPGVLADMGWTVNSSADADVRLYPNPGADRVIIRLAQLSSAVSLAIIDLSGKLVLAAAPALANGVLAQVDVSGLPNGAYIVVVTTPAETIRRKLIVVR